MAVEPREGAFGKGGGGEGSKFQAEGAESSEVERDSTAPWGLKKRREKARRRGRGGVMRGGVISTAPKPCCPQHPAPLLPTSVTPMSCTVQEARVHLTLVFR